MEDKSICVEEDMMQGQTNLLMSAVDASCLSIGIRRLLMRRSLLKMVFCDQKSISYRKNALYDSKVQDIVK